MTALIGFVGAGEGLPPDVQRSLDEAAKQQASPDEGDESTSNSRAAVAAAEIAEAAALLPERADVLLTDLLDHRCMPWEEIY